MKIHSALSAAWYKSLNSRLSIFANEISARAGLNRREFKKIIPARRKLS